MSNYSEDDVRRAAEIREWLIKLISDKQEEIEKLRIMLSLIDNLLKQGSFRAASNIGASITLSSTIHTPAASPQNSASSKQKATTATTMTEPTSLQNQQHQQQQNTAEFKEVRPLKRVKDNLLLANAELSNNSIEIVPVEGVNLNVNTTPFKSFFLNRILEGMKTKDEEKVGQGQIKESESLNYQVEEDNNGLIKRIIINNYRERERLNEIFNTSTWVFTRMIEKSDR
jgi:light-regulated signal transduction histidine kinase (bacteriophytochrome)